MTQLFVSAPPGAQQEYDRSRTLGPLLLSSGACRPGRPGLCCRELGRPPEGYSSSVGACWDMGRLFLIRFLPSRCLFAFPPPTAAVRVKKCILSFGSIQG